MAQYLLQVLVLIASLASVVSSAQSFDALVSPITKDSHLSLYSIAVNGSEELVIDLSLPYSWVVCKNGAPLVLCHSTPCSAVESYNQSLCSSHSDANVKSNVPCTCLTAPVNPITKECAVSRLTTTSLALSSTDGHNPLATVNFAGVYVSCAPRTLLRSLPQGVSGVASLSPAPLSLPSQFSNKIIKQFGICLPSTSTASGVAFVGKGPFYLLPPPGRDVTSLLSFTPLLNTTGSNLGYYIGLAGIAINQEAVTFPKGAFDLGHGGVKLSTTIPYTTLRSQLYLAFLKQFSKATSGIPRVKKVKPFDLCLNTTTLGSTRVGLPVASIDLELSNGKNWTIFGANSMKQVTDEVACLAFVDGGVRAEQAVVIGSFQMENSFLLFDLVGSRLGFTDTLFGSQTTCANFNFTSGV
ncbi:hypothetical protein Droror1_Dr00009986 [Drosera rotundifolia]